MRPPGCPWSKWSAALLAVVAFSGQVHADEPDESAQQYRSGQEAYEQGDYKRAIKLLRPLLYPHNRLSTAKKLIDAHKMLGISSVFEKDVAAAEQSFMAILAERPIYRLDPLIDPPAAVTLFQEVKQRNAEMLRQIEDRQRREQERRQQDELRKEAEEALVELVVEREVRRKPYWVNFVPFGAGQFQNGHHGKGYTLMASQMLLGTLSLACAIALRVAYPDGEAAEDELGMAQGLNITMVTSGALFWATVVYGIIDALVYYQPTEVTERRPRRHKNKGISLLPAVGAGSAQLQLGLSF